jgi:Ca-activated chloride channel family protein
MKVGLQATLNDANVDVSQGSNQRQLAISVAAVAEAREANLPLNLCLILDHSGSMKGEPLDIVKKAAARLIEQLSVGDRISVVAFDHRAKVIVPNQIIEDPAKVIKQINSLRADGGTAIDEGIKLGVEELGKGKNNAVSQAFVLTDGENEHGDDKMALKRAKDAAEYGITLNTLGFGEHWNSQILEQMGDMGGGTMRYIERPEDAVREFSSVFQRIQAVGLTNAYLLLSLAPKVRLAELKPIAQVAPDTIELPVQEENNRYVVRLGDLMKDVSRVVLANLYIGQLPEGNQVIADVQVRYDDPIAHQTNLFLDPVPVTANCTRSYQPVANLEVQQHILALAKYRQTQLAEQKLQQGDRAGAATMLQTAAKTALQMGDQGGATILQTSATRLQSGEELSEADKKKTKIVSKTILQG